jgi:hypothetical protein
MCFTNNYLLLAHNNGMEMVEKLYFSTKKLQKYYNWYIKSAQLGERTFFELVLIFVLFRIF